MRGMVWVSWLEFIHLFVLYANYLESHTAQFRSSQPFEDPAIMSASFVAPNDRNFAYGPPPGLPVPQRISPTPAILQAQQNNMNTDGRNTFAQGEFFLSHFKGREVSVPSAVLSQCGISTTVNDPYRKFFSPPSVALNSSTKN